MTDFPVINSVVYNQDIRPNQRNILPTVIKNRQLGSKHIKQSDIGVLGPVTFANGSCVTVTSTVEAKDNPLTRIGSVPYMIVFGEGTTVDTLTLIPFQLGDPTDYMMFGPMVLPVFEGSPVNGSTDSNLTFRTSLVNISGGNKTVMVLVQGRYILDTSSDVKKL